MNILNFSKGVLAFTVLSASIAMILPGASHAAPLSGVFDIDVYKGNGGGNISHPNSQANSANPLITGSGSALYSGTFTGDIDFDTAYVGSGNNILNFLTSEGGTLSGDASALNTIMSTATFDVTTVLDITWTGPGMAGTIRHDDGVSLYADGGVALASPFPTGPITENFDTLSGGNSIAYRLIYVATNNLPEVLTANITASTPVPVPSAFGLFGSALAGVVAWRMRKAKQA